MKETTKWAMGVGVFVIFVLVLVAAMNLSPRSDSDKTIIIVKNTTGADQKIWLKADCVPGCDGKFEEKGEIPPGGSWRGEFTEETVFTLAWVCEMSDDVPANGRNIEFVLEWLQFDGDPSCITTYSYWG